MSHRVPRGQGNQRVWEAMLASASRLAGHQEAMACQVQMDVNHPHQLGESPGLLPLQVAVDQGPSIHHGHLLGLLEAPAAIEGLSLNRCRALGVVNSLTMDTSHMRKGAKASRRRGCTRTLVWDMGHSCTLVWRMRSAKSPLLPQRRKDSPPLGGLVVFPPQSARHNPIRATTGTPLQGDGNSPLRMSCC